MSTEELASVKQAIAEQSRAFESRFASGDARALVEGYFVPDALGPVASPPGSKPLHGRAALVQMFEGQIRDCKAIRLETLSVDSSGTLAYELGRAHLSLRTGPEVKGRYAVLWQKTADGWRVKTDFFAEGWTD